MNGTSRALTAAVAMLVILDLALIGLAWAVRHHDIEQLQSRREAAISAARTINVVCRDYRGIELRRVRDQHRHLRVNLRLLGLAPTPTILRAARRAYRADLHRYSLTGCGQLPFVRRVEQAYHVNVTEGTP